MSARKLLSRKDRANADKAQRRTTHVKFKSMDQPSDAFIADFSADEFGDSPQFRPRDSPNLGPKSGSHSNLSQGSQTPTRHNHKSSRAHHVKPPVDQAELIMRSYGFDLDPRFYNASKYTSADAVDDVLDWSAVQYVWSFHRSRLPPSSLSSSFKELTEAVPAKAKDKTANANNAPTLPLEDAAHCPICLSTPVAAVSTRCGHVYCMACILEHIARSSERYARCPLCNNDVFEGMLRPYLSLSYIVTKFGQPVKLNLVFRAHNSLQAFAAEDFDQLQSKSRVSATLSNPFTGPAYVDLFDPTSVVQVKSRARTSSAGDTSTSSPPTVTSRLPVHGEYRFSRFSFTTDIRPVYQRMRSELVAALSDFRETFEVMQAIEDLKLQQQIEEESKKQKQAQQVIEQSLSGVWAKRAVARLEGSSALTTSSNSNRISSVPSVTGSTSGSDKSGSAEEQKLTGVKLDVKNYQVALKNSKKMVGYDWDEDPAAIFLKIALDRVDGWIATCTTALRRANQGRDKVSTESTSKEATKPSSRLKLSTEAVPFVPMNRPTTVAPSLKPVATQTPEELEAASLALALALSAQEAEEAKDAVAQASKSEPVESEFALNDAFEEDEDQDDGVEDTTSGAEHEQKSDEPKQTEGVRIAAAKAMSIDINTISLDLPKVASGVADSSTQTRTAITTVPSMVYFQSHSGEPLFLHPANMRALMTEFQSLEALPKTLIARVIGVERKVITERERRISPYASYLTQGSVFLVAFLDLDAILSPHTKALHGAELKWVADRIERQKQMMAKTDAVLTKKRETFIKAEFERAKRSASSEQLTSAAREAIELRKLLGEEAATALLAEREGRYFPTLPSASLGPPSRAVSVPSLSSGSPGDSTVTNTTSTATTGSVQVPQPTAAAVLGSSPPLANAPPNLVRAQTTTTDAPTAGRGQTAAMASPWGNSAARLAQAKPANNKPVGFPSLGRNH